MSGEPIVNASLRLPAALHARIKALADRERRSLHAQILVLLEEALEAREEQASKAAA